MNAGYWKNLEIFARNLTNDWDEVFSITGPSYVPYTDLDTKKYIKYEVIGKKFILKYFFYFFLFFFIFFYFKIFFLFYFKGTIMFLFQLICTNSLSQKKRKNCIQLVLWSTTKKSIQES